MTERSVRAGLTELLRPCHPTVRKEFVVLHAFKPFFELDPRKPDQERMDIVFDRLFHDIKDLPEVAVVLALDDLRNGKSKWFPIDEILPAVEEYRDLIYDALDFFGDKN